MTHKIAENVDDERDKVVNDLVFTSCVDMPDDMERIDVPMFTRNATGDPMRTDTRLAILQVNACAPPSRALQSDSAALPLHGSSCSASRAARFSACEAMSFARICTGAVMKACAG